MSEIRLPPFEVEELKGVRLLEELSNWAFKHFRVKEIHKTTQGRNVQVAVLDTGCPEHEDIQVAEAVDFTGEGKVDKQGHSTWVSGCLKAKGGFLGWAPGCELSTAKILDNSGEGAWLWMRKGLEWALENRFDIVNISAGGSYGGNKIQKILAKMAELGMLVVCAAGNAADMLIYPASDPSTIAVGSVNKELERSAFSGFGPRLITMAPGEDLLGCWLDNGYAKSSGTCLSEDMFIYTPDGPIKIKNINSNDTIYAFRDGKLIIDKCIRKIYQGENEVYKLFVGGQKIEVTKEHKFLRLRIYPENHLEWAELQNLRQGDTILLSTRLPENIEPTIDNLITKDVALWLGYFLGDGWLTLSGGNYQVNIAEGINKEENQRFLDLFKRNFGDSMKKNKTGRWYYKFSKQLAMILEMLGLHKKAQYKTIPSWIWHLSSEKQKAFYEGYLSSDGYNDKKRKSHSFECISEDLIKKLKALTDYLGYRSSSVFSRTRFLKAPNQLQRKWKTTWSVNAYNKPKLEGHTHVQSRVFTKEARLKIARELYDTKFFRLAAIRKIEKAEIKKVYDLSMEKNNNFIAEGIVVHNSMSSPQVAGLFALLRETKHIELKETVVRLAQTCLDMDVKDHDWVTGWGLIAPFKFLGLEPGKKITIDWIFKFFFFVLIYFFVGAPTAAMKKISKYWREK